jgi:hypothetical protein
MAHCLFFRCGLFGGVPSFTPPATVWVDKVPEGSATPGVLTGRLSLRTTLKEMSDGTSEWLSLAEVTQSTARIAYEEFESGAASRLARYAQEQRPSPVWICDNGRRRVFYMSPMCKV